MAIPGNVGGKKSTFSSPAAMAQAQRAAETQSMKALQDRREQTRKDFFKGRQDISNNRLDRRQIQKDLYEAFKNDPTKTKKVAGNLYQAAQPGGPTLADEAMRLANMYGPTFKEIGSDIGYGLGSIGKGIGDFIGRGGVIGSVLSGLYDKFKGGTQQGIETVKGLYDNLRKTLGGGEPPVVNYGGSSDIRVTDNIFLPTQGYDSRGYLPEGFSNVGIEQPQFPYNFETVIKPKPQPLQPSDMSQEQFMESFPELYSSLYQPRNYEPIRVSDMDMTGVTAQNFGLPSLKQSYDFLRNPQVETPLGNLRFDNVLSGNPQLGYGNTVMINGVPVDLNATIGNQGLSVGGSFSFKKGGSVDKYAGLGYKLK